MAKDKRCREAGFSLIELLVVMVILVLLTSVVAPNVIKYIGGAKRDTATVQAKNIQTALELYRVDNGRLPNANEGLDVLIARPANAARWNGPYLKDQEGLKDPWGSKFLYKSTPATGGYSLISYGSDGQEGGEGDAADIVITGQ